MLGKEACLVRDGCWLVGQLSQGGEGGCRLGLKVGGGKTLNGLVWGVRGQGAVGVGV
ncbi:hypothetical protein [Neisseria sp. P0019.S002]|uniref:hypothetical protein n=1 Tax=Neisseria sp. P0019.S002 TaxID=3436798 RepID=UPI003F7D36E0